jgi:hypothetical protein
VNTADPRVTTTTVSGASSSIRIDHGGEKTARSKNAPRARGPSRSPVKASISKTIAYEIEYFNYGKSRAVDRDSIT